MSSSTDLRATTPGNSAAFRATTPGNSAAFRTTTPGNSAAFRATTPGKAQREDFTWTLNSVLFTEKLDLGRSIYRQYL